MAKFIDFPTRKMGFGVALIAILAVALVSALGLLAPVTQLIGRAVGGIKATVMRVVGMDRRKTAAVLFFLLAGAGIAHALWNGDAAVLTFLPMVGLVPELWGFKRLFSRSWPIQGAQGSASPIPLLLDLKDVLQSQVLDMILVRVVGNVVVAGAGPGTATGKENPEALITSVRGITSPSLSVIRQGDLTARGIVSMGLFDRAYRIQHADVADAAGTTAIDFFLPLRFKQPGSVNPIEWSLPLSAFDQYNLTINCGSRDQLFTGGTNTWDLSGLRVEVWASFDLGIAGGFHTVEEFEDEKPFTASDSAFQIFLKQGFQYTHLLFRAERDNALVNDIINSITVESAGRVWTPHGDANALAIQRWNRETHVNSAAEALTGLYFVPLLRDGMYKRAVDASDQRIEVKLDLTLGGGTTRKVIVQGRRIIPLNTQIGVQPKAA